MPRHLLAPILALAASLLAPAAARADGFLRADGTRIVDETGRPVILRGMGLGGWMLQEGYMLQLGELGQQHVIRRRLAELIGEEKTAAFYQAWLDHHTTKADIDQMARWGFNSVRLPMHYDLLTLPIEREPAAGADTWLEEGFARIDRLLAWTKANGMYLILDLHAAPGGQGTDNAISDRDPAKPSLWESPENRRKTVALWKKLAERYADEPGIGAYDLINEPNWDFDGAGDTHGCQDKRNAPLRELLVDITAAIRSVDKRHMIVIEGNCWGNNYAGVMPLWDANTAISFHKYWNRNDPASLTAALKLRDDNKAPVWLGESGENSNVWFRDAIRLVEDEGIGWAWWPLKKLGFNNPLEVVPNPGWAKLVAYWTGKGPRPTAAEAEEAAMRLATHDIAFANNVAHPDVIDAMFRQPHSDAAVPFAQHRVGPAAGTVAAVEYDMGPAGVAYRDTVDANYHVATGGQRTPWNNGRTYRNDGVDIARDAQGKPYVGDFVDGEWLRYTVEADRDGARDLSLIVEAKAAGTIAVAVNGAAATPVAVPAGGWRTVRVARPTLLAGRNTLVVSAIRCQCSIRALHFAAAGR